MRRQELNPRMDLSPRLDWTPVSNSIFSKGCISLSWQGSSRGSVTFGGDWGTITGTEEGDSTPQGERALKCLSSLYRETATVFVNPKSDVRFNFAVQGFVNPWWNVSQNLNYSCCDCHSWELVFCDNLSWHWVHPHLVPHLPCEGWLAWSVEASR